MTNRDTNLNVNVTATDRATPTVRGVASEVEALEGTHTVDLDAAGNADDQLASIRSKLDLLTDSDKTIVLRGQADQLLREVGRAESKLRDIEKLDGEQIRVILDARDNATKKLDAVRTELRQLDGEVATVTVDARDRTGRSLDRDQIGTGVAAGSAAAIAAITAGAQQAASMSLEVQQIADLTGASLEEASRLAGVFRQSGVETSDLLDMLLNVNQQLRDNPELAEQLGIKVSAGTSLVDLFVQAVDKIGPAFDNAGERGVVNSQLFGEEGVRQVQAVKTAINQDLAPAMEQFQGPIVTDESVENARQVNAEIAEVEANVQKISLALLPVVNGLLNGVISYFDAVGDAGDRFGNFVRNDLLGGSRDSNLTPRAIEVRNTAGYTGGAVAGYADDGSFRSPLLGAVLTQIFNPPGTPAATNQSQQTYLARNGVRLS